MIFCNLPKVLLSWAFEWVSYLEYSLCDAVEKKVQVLDENGEVHEF